MARSLSWKHLIGGALGMVAVGLLIVLLGTTASAQSPRERLIERFSVLGKDEPSGFTVGDSPQETSSLRSQGGSAVQDTGTGPDFRGAREARGIQGARVWVAPNQSDQGACVLSMPAGEGGVAFSCGGDGTLSNGALLTAGGQNPSIVGVVPDGASKVKLTYPTGATETVPVKDNAFYAPTPARGGAPRATFTTQDGKVHNVGGGS